MVTRLREGASVGGYRVRALLFSAVAFDAYSAVDQRGGAVCVLHRAHGSREIPSDEAFASDLEKLKAVNSRWLPKVLSGGRDNSASWVVTESIGGTEPLWTPGAEPVSWLRVMIAARRIGRALHSAMEEDCYHGGFEPKCIRKWKKGRIWVIGVGVARLFGLDMDAVHTSPRYFAPEQVLGSPIPVSTSTDIYAVGMCLYGALLGREPFEGATDPQLLGLAQHGSPEIVLSAAVPSKVWEWIAKSTAKSPSERFENWEDSIALCSGVLKFCADEVDEREMLAVLMEDIGDMDPDTLSAFERSIRKSEKTADTGTGTGTGTDTDTGADTGAGTGTGTDADTGTGADTGADTGTDMDADAGADTDAAPLSSCDPPANDVRASRPPVPRASIVEPSLTERFEPTRARSRQGGAAALASILLGLVGVGALLVWISLRPPPIMAEHSLADLPSPLHEASNASARTEARRAAADPAKPYFAEVQRRRSMGHPDDDKIRKQWSGACSSIFDCDKLASSK